VYPPQASRTEQSEYPKGTLFRLHRRVMLSDASHHRWSK
jgi:hypothetical protein